MSVIGTCFCCPQQAQKSVIKYLNEVFNFLFRLGARFNHIHSFKSHEHNSYNKYDNDIISTAHYSFSV